MAGYNKKGDDGASTAGGFYNDPPLCRFKNLGGEWVPVVNWLRLCPWNDATSRWHIPMKDDRTGGVYWFFYRWLRGKEFEYQPIINEAMGMKRGLFVDTASQYHYGDFWLVADQHLSVDRALMGDVSGGIPIATPIFQAATSCDMLLPDQNGVFSGDWLKAKEPWDSELQQAMDAGKMALASMQNKSRYMKHSA